MKRAESTFCFLFEPLCKKTCQMHDLGRPLDDLAPFSSHLEMQNHNVRKKSLTRVPNFEFEKCTTLS